MRYLFKLTPSLLMLSCLALLSGLVPAIPASLAAPVAQSPAQAGLVVRFGDGSVRTACVDLGAAGQMTGEQALRQSGLTTIVAFDPGQGSAVCKIEQEGCNYPAEGCFCQCTLAPGQQCRYWAYYQWNNNDWVFSQGGSSSRILRDGDVDGWSWGPGGVGLGVEPPAVPFEEICVPPATATPTATATPPPTATPTATATATATATTRPTDAPAAPPPPTEAPVIMPVATSTPQPSPTTVTATALPATATTQPTATLQPTATGVPPTATPVPPMPTVETIATPAPGLPEVPSIAPPTPVSEAAVISTQPDPAYETTPEETPDQTMALIALITPSPAPVWLPMVQQAGAEPTVVRPTVTFQEPTIIPVATATPTATPEPSPTAVPTPTPAPTNQRQGLTWFLVMSVALAGALVAARSRREQGT